MKNKLFTIYFLIVNFFVFSQEHELGKVTLEELNQKTHPIDTSAVAAILFEKGQTLFDYDQNNGFSLKTEVEVKIKIYKKEGFDWANKSVFCYIGNNSSEKVSFSKAITYNIVNGVIEKTKLKSEGEITEKKNKYWEVKKIIMPNVKEGSIIEYKYVINSPFISTFPDWNFQNVIPTNFSEYTTRIPEYFKYNVYRKGFVIINEEKSQSKQSIMLSYKERESQRYTVKTTWTNEQVSYTENKSIYTATNVPALNIESYVNNMNNYTSAIQHELSGKQMPQSIFESFATSWEDVAKKIYENEEFGNQLNKNSYFEEDINTIVKDLVTPQEKITAIFDFVKNRMNWNNFYGYLTDLGVKKAYQDKTGNTADINLMLVSMLRYAGFDSDPILISTRANGISIFPSRTAFNNVIVGVKMDTEYILLDATNKNSIPNIIPIENLNWIGRRIKENGISEMIDLMPKNNSSENVNMIATIDNQGQVTGQVRDQYFDYYAFQFRESYGSLSTDSYLEKLEKRHSGLEIENYERINEKEIYQPLAEKYSFKSNNAVEIIGDKMYFSPLLHYVTSENPFKQEKREYPVDFSYPTKDKYMITLNIPDGYQVETYPKEVAIALPEGYGSFRYTCTVEEKKVQLMVNLNINVAIIPSDDYDTLKEFFKKVVEKENEKIVLKKI